MLSSVRGLFTLSKLQSNFTTPYLILSLEAFNPLAVSWSTLVNSDGGVVEALSCLSSTVNSLDTNLTLTDQIDLFKQKVIERNGFVMGQDLLRSQIKRYQSLGITPNAYLTPYGVRQRGIFDFYRTAVNNPQENLLLQSENFNLSPWGSSVPSATVTYNAAQNPLDSNMNAARVDVTANNSNVSSLAQILSLQSGFVYTLTLYVKALNSLGQILLRGDGSGNNTNLTYTFATDTVTTSGTFTLSGTRELLSDGWVRLILVFRPNATGSYSINPFAVFQQPVGTSYLIAQPNLSNTGFAIPYTRTTTQVISPVWDFSRNSIAARRTRNQILESVRNQFTYSRDFSNAVWGKSTNLGLVQNQAGLYNEPNTAWLVTASSNGVSHQISSSGNLVTVVGTTYTEYWIVKRGSSPFAQLFTALTGTAPNLPYANFNLDLGTVTASSYAIPYIKQLTNGFWLIGISYVATTASSTHSCAICPIPTPTHGRNTTYTGSGESIIVLSAGRIVGNLESNLPFILHSNNVDLPRTHWSLDSMMANLLMEPAATNSLTDSHQLQNWSTFSSPLGGTPTVTGNSTAVTDPFGQNQATFIEGTSPASSKGIYRFVPTGLAAGTYTVSVFVRAGTHGIISLQAANFVGVSNPSAYFDIINLTVTGANARIENWGNGWYRCINTFTFTTATDGNQNIAVYIAPALGNPIWALDEAVGKNLYVTGAQLELGTFATSPIITTGSTATRIADACTMPNTIFNREGTIVFELLLENPINKGMQYMLNLDGGSNYARIRFSGAAWQIEWFVGGSFISQPSVGGGLSEGRHRICFSFKENNFTTIYVDGVKALESALSSTFTPTTIRVSDWSSAPGYNLFQGIALINTKLTDAQCIALTQL